MPTPTPVRHLYDAELRARVPRLLLDELDAAAEANGQTRSGLVRLILRAFLRQRYGAAA